MNRRGTLTGAIMITGLVLVAGCTAGDPSAPSTTPIPTVSEGPPSTTSALPSAGPTDVPTIVEPTTTNTLPPPPAPTGPAPRRAGPLTARSLPVPAGWTTVTRKGGAEEGYEGNGSWVHGRDPRYAAQDVITLGCAPVTRDDYPDPVAALEGTYVRRGDPGIGLTLQFASTAKATAYLTVYRAQLDACTDPDALKITVQPGDLGLVDRRTYPDGDWTEVVRQVGPRLTMIILTDPGHAMTTEQTTALLARIGTTSRR